MEKIQEFEQMVRESRRVVFFGGAGVSTESGIPDFRSENGLFNRKYDDPPETILSHEFLFSHPSKFYKFYREQLLCPQAQPNACHRKLAEMEKKGLLLSVITQNIDGLHQAAGSRRVWELHGSVKRNHCVRCGRFYKAEELPEYEDYPKCACGGMIRPDVVMYGEALDEEVLDGAIEDLQRADLLIIAGTSLRVYPAAGLIRYFGGNKSVVINKTSTPADEDCSLVLKAPVGQVFERLKI